MKDKKGRTPYIGFNGKQLASAPKLGKTAKCPKCGAEVPIEESKPPMLQFINHCGIAKLVGVKGKDVRNIKPACSGTINCT